MEIKNKVAESGIITINLEDFFPKKEVALFDIRDHLFMEMILKEKDFREALKTLNWEKYRDKNVGIICSADAIIPQWAYMLVMAHLFTIANFIAVGDADEVKKRFILTEINSLNTDKYRDARIVIKGCGDLHISDYAYVEITRVLLPFAKSIMYGEPCSTVPVYKRK